MAAASADAVTSEGSPTTSSEFSTHRGLVGQKLGRYEILCELATGGMAAVYIARAQGLAGFERLVAIKVMHPHLAHEEEFISMFLDEARLAARIRHPNVVATQDINDSGGDGFFLVMDYVSGDHLGAMLGAVAATRRTLPPMVVARVITDALNGLAAAHDLVDESGTPLHIVHRDISPHNILVGTDGTARLTDFGVAKAEERLSSTRMGQFKGKLSYVAPEQAQTGECDHRSDLFAMGIVLWEALTARRLFRGETGEETLKRLTVEPIPSPSAVKPSLAAWDPVLERALARDPDQRFQSAHEFVDAIETIAHECGGIATPRALAATLQELVGEKLEEEKRKVKSAISTSNGPGYVTLTRIPIPSTATPGRIPAMASSPRIAIHEGALTSGEFATHTVLVQEVTSKTAALLIAALFAVALAAGFGGYYASHSEERERSQTIVVRSTEPPRSRNATTLTTRTTRSSPIAPSAMAQPAPAALVGTSAAAPSDATESRTTSSRATTAAPPRRARARRPAPLILEENPYNQ